MSEQTGVAPSTLRSWDRRYGLSPSAREDDGAARYSAHDVAMVHEVRRLVDAGWKAARAVSHVRGLDGREMSVAQLMSQESKAGYGALALAAGAMYPALAEEAVRDAFASRSFEDAVDDWLMPGLRDLGSAWEAGMVDVAGEHLVSGIVERFLSRAFDEAGRSRGPLLVCGLPQGAYHGLPLLAFATAARRRGLDVLFLGTDVPLSSFVAVHELRDPAAYVVGVPRSRDRRAARALVEELGKRPRTVPTSGRRSRPGCGHRAGPRCCSDAT